MAYLDKLVKKFLVIRLRSNVNADKITQSVFEAGIRRLTLVRYF